MELKNLNQQLSTKKLEKAYTFFMVPFYYHGNEWDEIHQEKLGKWIPVKEELYNKDDVLYPYIMDLFKQKSDIKKTRLQIYEFDAKDNGPSSQLFVERVLGKKNVAVIAKNAKEQKNPTTISFVLKKDGNFAPHLTISPSANIGILTFAIELEDHENIDNLKLLNYFLQKRDEVEKYQCVCVKPDNQEEIESVKDLHDAACNIPDLWKKNKFGKVCNQFRTKSNIDFVCWDIKDFVDCLLANMKYEPGKPQLKYFSKDRIHTFTFCSLDDPQNSLDEKAITPDLLRLSRSVVDSYMLPFDLLEKQGAVLRTYDNIFFSSAIEGSAMLCIAKAENKSFIANIHNTFNRQYFLIYLLVLIQRYTLLSLEQKLTEFESTEKDDDETIKNDDETLWNLINVICRIKVNCYYTDVSIYTHHSQFYQHCCKNLHIPETFKEIDEKVELLKLTTDRKMHILMEAQREIQEEEARRHQEEIERIKLKEKEDEEKRRIEKEQEEQRLAKEKEEYNKRINEAKDEAERRQHILNWVVAILTIAQVIQASYEVISHFGELKMYLSLGIGLLGIALLVWLMWKDIIDFIMRIRTR